MRLKRPPKDDRWRDRRPAYGDRWCRYCGEPEELTNMMELFAGFYLHSKCLRDWKDEAAA
jgi:hypothetical protein